MKCFLSWWLSVLSIGAALFYAFHVGAASLFVDDATRITYCIAALFLGITTYLGIAARAAGRCPNPVSRLSTAFRAAVDAQNMCMMLGLLGTALGAIALYKTKLVISGGDAAASVTMLSAMLGGLGTIFGCTAVAGASTFAIMVQAFVLKRSIGQ